MKPRGPLIVDVKRHSLEDGPGIRSVVFFKGCPLRCVFCQNPETQDPGPEIAFSARRCMDCGACEEACPRGAVDLDLPGRVRRDVCDACGKCAEACPGQGLRLIGTRYTVEQLAEILLRDRAFYRHSGGGVTLSGGECTLFPDYVGALLRRLKQEEIHVVLETSGFFDYDAFELKILPYLDLIYYDIKIADRAEHEKHVGKPNDRILENFHCLVSSRAVKVHPRVPLVPGVTATRENLAGVVDLLCDAGADDVSLVPYNPAGIGMYESLGRCRPRLPVEFMRPEEEKAVRDMFEATLRGRKRFSASGAY